jgi:predicted RNase H-like nuclease (RuvC/YqgF family)
MLLEEWSLDEAREVWREEGFELAAARYQPVIEDKNREIRDRDRLIGDKDRENRAIKREIGNKDRVIGELRRKLREAGIDT